MTTFEEEIFSTWEASRIYSDLPSNQESKAFLPINTNCAKTNDKSPVSPLLAMDDTIFNNIELEINCIQAFVKEKKQDDEHKDLYKSMQAVYNEIDWDTMHLNNSEFKKHNSIINEELNNSVNLLKTKLFTPFDKKDEPPIKKKDTSWNRRCTSPNVSSFYGLPNKVKDLIQKYKGIQKLYDWQDECLKMKAISERKNLIYALPTSGGKTLVAEILMLREILCNKKNAIFILPYVALVQEKIQSMTQFALELNFLIEEYAAEKGQFPPKKRRKKNTIYICTIEKSQAIINCLIELDRFNEIGIVVVDELHLLGEDNGRGATLECLLTKIMYTRNDVHIVGMSATIGNINEISDFLKAELYIQNFRPVTIKEYVKCENEIWLINYKEDNIFTDKKIINYKYQKKDLQLDPDFLGGLVMDVAPKDSVLIFCSTKKNCENVALLLTNVLFRSFQAHKADEKNILLRALETESGRICPVLRKTIVFGVAYHHSGLTAEERKLLEDAFKSGTLCVICCTSTLAAGVNLPARRVILRSPFIGPHFLNLSRYKQMIGRAGRAGLGDIGESILVCTKRDTEKVGKLLRSKMNDSISSLHVEKHRGINNLIISSVLLSIATTRADIHRITSKSLLKIQESRLGVSTKEVVDKALTALIKDGILRVKTNNSKEVNLKLETSVIFPTQCSTSESDSETISNATTNPKKEKKRSVTLVNSSQLELCPLGKASMKGCIDLYTAQQLYDDLMKARENLILVDYLHLLYLITPYDIASQIKPVGTIFYEIMTALTPHQMKIARTLGINEAVVDKIRAGITPKNVDIKIVQRFYVTLMLHDLWNRQSIFHTADKYQVNRGTIQNLLSLAASFSSSVVRFCEELEELWAFKDLFTAFGQKLTYCCAAELEPLMDLPFVKIGRAKQLYKAGYKTLQSIAKAKPDEIMSRIEHLPRRVVFQIISTAKLLIMEKVENLRDEVEEVLEGLEI